MKATMLLVLILAAWAGTASATSYVERSLTQLLDEGGPVVAGKVVSVERRAVPGPRDGGEQEVCTLRVTEVFRGTLKPGDQLHLPTAVANSPTHFTYQVGDEGIWLLSGPPRESEYGVGIQSLQPVARKAEIERALALQSIRVSLDVAPLASPPVRRADRLVTANVTVNLTNEGKQPVTMANPANGRGIAFCVHDAQGNAVAPVMRGKAEAVPDRSLTLEPGQSFACRVEGMTFTTSTGLFGYDLDPAKEYRVTVVYRPDGMRARGIGSSEELLAIVPPKPPIRPEAVAAPAGNADRNDTLPSLRAASEELGRTVGGQWEVIGANVAGVTPYLAGTPRGAQPERLYVLFASPADKGGLGLAARCADASATPLELLGATERWLVLTNDPSFVHGGDPDPTSRAVTTALSLKDSPARLRSGKD